MGSQPAGATTHARFPTNADSLRANAFLGPGRGFLRRRERRWLTRFLLIIAGSLVIWGLVLLPLVGRYLRVHELLGDTSLLFISRLALVQAIIGILALSAKGIALAIPYVKRFTAKLSDLTWFH
ncbi:MAG: hypothetical protein B1H03_06935 [Planctomycetales bacterium 4484_113]|nr:MAG: hypothetical protein B1H03_06935 [Planctomycetales bacterium 4484_113]